MTALLDIDCNALTKVGKTKVICILKHGHEKRHKGFLGQKEYEWDEEPW